MPTRKTIDNLGANIVKNAISAAQQLTETWPDVLGEKPLTTEASFMVRAEMLWFFLLMLERYALSIGGPKVRDTLQDAIVENAILTMLTVSFDTSKARNKAASEEWLESMLEATLDEYNETASDYNQCKELMNETPDISGKRTVLGKLSVRIASKLGQQHNPTVLLFVTEVAAKELVKSGLKKQIEASCKALC